MLKIFKQKRNWGRFGDSVFDGSDEEDSDKDSDDSDDDFDAARIPKGLKKHPGLSLKHKAHLKQVNKWRRKSKSGAEDYLAIILNAYIQGLGGNAIPAEAILSRALGEEYSSSKLTNMNKLDLEDMKVGNLFIKAHCHLFRDTKGMNKIEQQLLALFADASVVVKTKVLIKELVSICSDPGLEERKAASRFSIKIHQLKQNEAHRIKMNCSATPSKLCPSWNSFDWCPKSDDCPLTHACLICKSTTHSMVNCDKVEEKTRWRMRTMNQRWKKNAPSNKSPYYRRNDRRWRGGRGGFNGYGRGGYGGYPQFGRPNVANGVNNHANNNAPNNGAGRAGN